MDFGQHLKTWTRVKNRSESIVKLLRDISRFEQNRIQHVPQLSKRLTQLDQLLTQSEPETDLQQELRDCLHKYRQELTQSEQAFKKRFGAILEQELTKRGLSLSGQYPDLKTGLFTIELDFDRERVTIWYGPKQERLTACRFQASEVASQIATTKKQIGCGLPLESFVDRLQKAYERVTGDILGEPVAVIDILRELAYLLQNARFHDDPRHEYYKGYGRVDFSYDLYLLRQSAHSIPIDHRPHLIVATRTHTRRRRDFLWVPDNESGRGTTYSHLQFRKVMQ